MFFTSVGTNQVYGCPEVFKNVVPTCLKRDQISGLVHHFNEIVV